MTALENVAAPLELAGARQAFEQAREELDQVGLGDRMSVIRRSCLAANSSASHWPGHCARDPRS